ncbi:MAG TPA: aminomethyl-transferring glycine dehydrogenase subunit GcvPA [Syntrophomonas sp.]|nr:aminomethyl-transferring glycine dehydrogenase subunit GcvPA [Syntrophomonas sp.]
MRYTPNSSQVALDMLKDIGLNQIEDLFNDIPQELQLGRELDLGPGMTEMEIKQKLNELAGRNVNVEQMPCFLGAGAYDHYIPAALDQMLMRSEFYTAYTPYQAEISQGILQSIFEYQTLICNLTGMDVANASMYDGATALAEACALACESTRRSKVLVPDTIHPEYLQVLKTYAISGNTQIETIPCPNGVLDEKFIAGIDRDTACIVIQQPNFYGNLEDIQAAEQTIHGVKGMLIMVADPISLALLKPPAEWGADIVAGEGQSLGSSLSFGGPYLGFLAVSKKLMRKSPGRIVGQTLDQEGRRSFVLTLQAREQHIRREKATSNICSNQALNALAAAIYFTLVGPRGLKEIALRSHQLALYASKAFTDAGLALKYQAPFFREFAIKVDDPQTVNRRLLSNGIIGGYELEDALLFAFTEKRTRQEIDKLVQVIGGMKNE